jgi:hypothetical protein
MKMKMDTLISDERTHDKDAEIVFNNASVLLGHDSPMVERGLF